MGGTVQPSSVRVVVATVGHLMGVIVIGLIDYATGVEIQLSAVYLIPIMSAAYWWGRVPSLLVAIAAAAAWFANTDLIRVGTADLRIAAWNGLSRLVIYVVLAFLVDTVKQQRTRAQQLAVTDPLTGLANRRQLQESLQTEVVRAERYDGSVALLVVDVDDLKRFNDTAGHSAGDNVLKSVGSALRRSVRRPDLVARWAGDEFAVLQPGGTVEGAAITAQRILDTLRATPSLVAGRPEVISVSIGIAAYPAMGTLATELMRVADEALYKAKREGKGRAAVGVRGGLFPETGADAWGLSRPAEGRSPAPPFPPVEMTPGPSAERCSGP